MMMSSALNLQGLLRTVSVLSQGECEVASGLYTVHEVIRIWFWLIPLVLLFIPCMLENYFCVVFFSYSLFVCTAGVKHWSTAVNLKHLFYNSFTMRPLFPVQLFICLSFKLYHKRFRPDVFSLFIGSRVSTQNHSPASCWSFAKSTLKRR